MDTQTTYEPGVVYPMTEQEAAVIMRSLGMMARIMARGKPDIARGRRYGHNGPDSWEFWLTSGQKVSILVQRGGGFIGSIGDKADRSRPKPLPVFIDVSQVKTEDAEVTHG